MSTSHIDGLQQSPAASGTSREQTRARPRPRPGPRRRGGRGAQLAAWGFLAPVIAYLGAFYAFPLYRNVDLSLRHYTVRSFVQGGAPFSGWDNFRQVIDDPTFSLALRNTMVFTLVSILFQYVLSRQGSKRQLADDK